MSEKITFQELINSIADQTNHSRQSTHDFLKEFVSVINDGLEDDGAVNIAGLGKFKLRPVDQRQAYNPQTGENISVPAHNRVVFKPYKYLRELVNAPYSHLEPEFIDDTTDTKNTVTNTNEDGQKSGRPPVSSDGAKATDQRKEKAPWEQALEATPDDDTNPDDPFGFSESQQQNATLQPNEEIIDDTDIVEYSPHIHQTPVRNDKANKPDHASRSEHSEERNNEQPASEQNSDKHHSHPAEDTDSQLDSTAVTAGTKVLNIPGPKATGVAEESTASTKNQPQKEFWVVAAVWAVLLLAGGFWYFTALSHTDAYQEMAAKSVHPTADRQAEPATSGDGSNAGSTANDPKATPVPQASTAKLTIKKGQTLWSLARQQYNDPYLWPWIFDENNSSIDNPDLILTGQTLDIPIPAGGNEGLSGNDSLLVAIGYVETYRWYKANGFDKARHYLYAAKIYNGNVLEYTDVTIDEADLAFANRVQ